MAERRRYSFPPPDDRSVLLGLTAGQCLALAATFGVVAGSIRAGMPTAATVLAAGFGLAVALGSIGGEPLWTVGWLAAGLATARHHGQAQVRLEPDRVADVPGIGERDLFDAPAPWSEGSVALVVDRRRGQVSVPLSVTARRFLLADRSEQDRVVAAWGVALAAFCTGRSPVVQIAVSSWTGPSGADLVECSTTRFRASRTTVWLTCAAQRGGLERTARRAVEEARLLASRLDEAGLDAVAVDRDGVLARIREQLGVAPDVVATTSVRRWTDLDVAEGSAHRAWAIAAWPRRGVESTWLERLLLDGEATRCMTVVMEPVSPVASRRRLDRDSVRLATDEEQRRRAGFRVGWRQARARGAVEDRDAELADGFAEIRFAGVVTCSAAAAELNEHAGEVAQAAAQCGLELRALHGRHDLGVGLALGLGVRPSSGGLR